MSFTLQKTNICCRKIWSDDAVAPIVNDIECKRNFEKEINSCFVMCILSNGDRTLLVSSYNKQPTRVQRLSCSNFFQIGFWVSVARASFN